MNDAANAANAAKTAYPAFCHESLNDRLARIKGSYKTQTVETLKDRLIDAQHSLICALSGENAAKDFWAKVGDPAIVKAIKTEIQLRKFKDAAESPDYAYATSGHSVCPDYLNIYRNDPKSPTGVAHVTSISKLDAYEYGEAQAILAGRSVHLGGQAAR